MNFGIILGGFWHHFGNPNAFKNRVKFWMRFWRPTEAPGHLQEGRPGGMRGVPGEDIEGPQGGETAAPLFILGDFVEAFVGERSPFEEVAL